MRILATLLAVLATACLADEEIDTHADDGSLYEQAYEEGQAEGKTDGTDCSGVRIPDRNGFAKRIALTFDDGPNPATTPAVIEVLHEHHAPATFFNNGVRYGTAGATQVAAQIAADPDFILANHSQNHLNLAQQSLDKVTSEVDRTDGLLRAAGETPKFFRFPFGSATCSYMKLVRSKGYIVTGWHIDSADWCYAAGGGTCKKSTFKYVDDALRDNMLGYILAQAKSTGGGILLMHDIHANTAAHLDEILTALEQHGFTFVRIDDIAAFPKLNAPPAP